MTQAAITNELLDYIKKSPSPFHATKNAAQFLLDNGFIQLDENGSWNCQANQAYFVTRNDSSIIAFQTGSSFESGFHLVGAHTDSPCPKIKPNAYKQAHGYHQLGVEIYGGALLHPWLDRDLSIAGRVSGLNKNGELSDCLIDFEKPVAVIPNLAIHLDRDANNNKTINPQNHCPLIISGAQSEFDFQQALIEQSQGSLDKILDFELYCYDTQAPSYVGINDEFIASARLDNLLSTYIGLKAIIDYKADQPALFVATDHEEVGSASACGAQGPFLQSTLQRLVPNIDLYNQMISRSVMLSCDNAHALHPNYADKHDAQHGPVINQGPVIKTNANQRYATNSRTSALLQHLCDKANIPLQHFVVRSDMGCGSTIGPITASELGIDTIDIGAPQWAMHSIRETAGAKDCDYLYQACLAFLQR
jgi:aspartyl aminopeptidase